LKFDCLWLPSVNDPTHASALRGDSQTAFLRHRAAALKLWGYNMVRPKITTCALLGLAMALASCATPKATVVAQPPANKKVEKEPNATFVEPPVPALPGDEIRMPADMVGLPKDEDFKATTPVGPKSDPGAGAVFVRPPTDPPSRVKPKPTE